MNWSDTENELNRLRNELNRLHGIGEKNWSEAQKEEARLLRSPCVSVGEKRYTLAGASRKNSESR